MLKNSRHNSDNFTIFEESDQQDEPIVKKSSFSEISCQTEDTTLAETEVQTDDSISTGQEAESETEKYEDVAENEEKLINYWKRVIAGQDREIDRIRKLNDVLEEKLAARKSVLGDKKDDYTDLYTSASSALEHEEKETDESSTYDEEDDDEKDDSITVTL